MARHSEHSVQVHAAMISTSKLENRSEGCPLKKSAIRGKRVVHMLDCLGKAFHRSYLTFPSELWILAVAEQNQEPPTHMDHGLRRKEGALLIQMTGSWKNGMHTLQTTMAWLSLNMVLGKGTYFLAIIMSARCLTFNSTSFRIQQCYSMEFVTASNWMGKSARRLKSWRRWVNENAAFGFVAA